MFLSSVAPIYTKQGNGGGIYILPEFRSYKNYLTDTEENFLYGLISIASNEEKRILCGIITKFTKNPMQEIAPFNIVKSHYTASNLAYLQMVFMGGPSKVIVERIQTDGDIATALERLKNKQWYYLIVPQITEAEVNTVVTYITEMRSLYHKTFKAVLPNCSAGNEGIINFATDNIKVGTKTYTSAEFCVRIAGILAGLPLNRSATYYALTEVENITESQTPDADVDNGKLILINDGTKIKICEDYGIPIDTIPELNIEITQLYLDKVLSDIIKDILKLCGGGYNLDVTPKGVRIYKLGDFYAEPKFRITSNTRLISSTNLRGNVSHSKSIEEMKNSIKIVSEKDSVYSLLASRKDDGSISQYAPALILKRFAQNGVAPAIKVFSIDKIN